MKNPRYIFRILDQFLLHSSPLVLFTKLVTVLFGFSYNSHRSFTNCLRVFLGPFLTSKYHAKELLDIPSMPLQSCFLSDEVFKIPPPQSWELRCPTVLKASQVICSEEILYFSINAALSDKKIFKIPYIKQGVSGFALVH